MADALLALLALVALASAGLAALALLDPFAAALLDRLGW